MFPGSTLLAGSKETELGSSDQDTSSSAGKKTGIVLVRVSTWKYVPTVTFGGADISKLPRCHLLQQMSSH